MWLENIHLVLLFSTFTAKKYTKACVSRQSYSTRNRPKMSRLDQSVKTVARNTKQTSKCQCQAQANTIRCISLCDHMIQSSTLCIYNEIAWLHWGFTSSLRTVNVDTITDIKPKIIIIKVTSQNDSRNNISLTNAVNVYFTW